MKKDNKNVGSIDLHNKWYYRLTGLDYKYELLEDGKRCNFTFDTSIGHMDISFIRDNYNVKIDMSPNDKIFNDKLKLRDYFMNLEFPIKIHELCKDIKDKFFIDLNNIDYFRVETYKDQICGDNLLIKNGKILKFEMNIGDKHLLVGDGLMFYYSSDSLNGLVEVDMYYDNDIVTRYEVALDNGIVNEDMGNVMYNHINSAVYEKVRVRKMINEFLNNDNS